jgi:hypothetical protein
MLSIVLKIRVVSFYLKLGGQINRGSLVTEMA